MSESKWGIAYVGKYVAYVRKYVAYVGKYSGSPSKLRPTGAEYELNDGCLEMRLLTLDCDS